MAFLLQRTTKAAEPSYDEVAKRISMLGFMKLRELSRDYREHGAKRGPWFGGFRGWLNEMVDRQLDEEAAKNWEDAYYSGCED